MRYDAFISYSHAADGKLAPALQSGLHRLARPWYRMRALHVFRDATSLAASPGLWGSIERALGESRYFILMASPAAADSDWVGREVEWWAKNRSPDHLLIVLTDGDVVWREVDGGFDPDRTTALPTCLHHSFRESPLHVDLRWARSGEMLSLRHARFRAAVLDLAAPLHGRPKDQIDGEDLRQHRRTRRVAALAVVGLLGLTAVSVWSTHQAIQQRDLAVSRQLAVTASAVLETDPELATLLAIEGVRRHASEQAEAVLRRAMLEVPLGVPLQGHRGSIHAMALDPRGERLLTGSADRSVRIWDLATGAVLAELSGHQSTVRQAAFSPDGALVLTVSDEDRDVRIWRADGSLALQLTGYRAQWVGDGHRLLVAASDGSVRLWNAVDGRKEATLQGHSGWIHGIAVSGDGRYAVTVGRDGTAHIWDLDGGIAAGVLRGHDRSVEVVAISPDGGRVATFDEGGAGRLWTLPDGKPLAQLDGHSERVEQAVWERHGDLIATASRDHTVRVWDAGAGRAIHVLSGHVDHVTALAWSPDGNRLATGSDDGTARIWGTGGRTLAVLRGHGAQIRLVAFAQDGESVLTAGQSSVIRRWRIPGDWRRVELRGHVGGVRYAGITSDGRRVMTVDRAGTFRGWDPASGYPLAVLHTTPEMLVVSPDPTGARVIAALGSESVATLYEVATGAQLMQFHGHSEELTCAGWDGTAARAITASRDGNARVWDAATGHMLASLPGHGAVRVCPALSPDGQRALIAGADRIVRVWDVEREAVVVQLVGNAEGVNQVGWSSDGSRVLIAGSDYLARVYDAQSGQMLDSIRMAYQQGHVYLSFDGRRLLAPGPAGQAVWTLGHSSRVPVTIPGAPSAEVIAAWSPDGRAVVTVNTDGQAVIQPDALFVSLAEVLERACARVTANLTEQEWDQYVGAPTYRPTCLNRPTPEWPNGR
ncbi:MAG TPA: TIR domain-containing protein [Thauera sp.]|uniref:hypothetical protein n=1 Tax=Thauera sp. TaxID=1905334 RepID=UPI002BE24F8E|nr:hypothetical protein [Thauera sp.]HRP23042.1 TIR domain-containing protein [Thauera sp.]HRP64471.1 TIR domain-containing protein [Thauera sp.]